METQPYFCGNQLVQKNCSFFCAELWPAWSAASPFPRARSRVCQAGTGRVSPPQAPLPACTGPCAFPGLHTPSLAGVIPQTLQLDYAPAVLLGAFPLKFLVFWAALQKTPEKTPPHTHHSMRRSELGTTCCLTTSFHDRQVSVKFSLMPKIAAVLKRKLIGLFCPCLQPVLFCCLHFVLSTWKEPKELQQKVTKVQEKG